IALQSDGKIVIGGEFTAVAFTTRNGAARLNSDGTLDTSFADPNLNAGVFSLLIKSDGSILLGGRFTSADGYAYGRLARYSNAGVVDTT
ncbi:delta-60 repeat domain-containing protein, partial [Acinetobacter baumannii]